MDPVTMTLLGGIFGAANDNSQRNKDRYLNSPAGIRAEAEKAGFNPLLFTGSAGSFGAGYAPQMGSKISSSFALAGDQMQREQELLLQQTRLEQENQRLAILAKQSQLNVADRGGIYGNRSDTALATGGGVPDALSAISVPTTIESVELNPATMTSMSNVGKGTFADPIEVDAAASEEVIGENEIYQYISSFYKMYRHADYNAALDFLMKRSGGTIGRTEMHQRVLNDPRIRSLLPNVWKRAVLSSQDNGQEFLDDMRDSFMKPFFPNTWDEATTSGWEKPLPDTEFSRTLRKLQLGAFGINLNAN